jgi:hypothetical protein
MIRYFAILFIGLALAQPTRVKVIQESRAGSTRNLTLIGKLDERRMEEKALEVLSAPEITMGRLLVYPSEESSRIVFRENQESCISQGLFTFLKDNGLPTNPLRCPEVSEAIKVGPNILLRMVGADCRTRTRLLRGRFNPLIIRALGEQHEILSVSIWIASKSKEVWGQEYPGIAVFVRTHAKLGTPLAREISAQMKGTSGARDVLVVVRNDVNFGKDCKFPQPYLFGGLASMTENEGSVPKSGGEVICVDLYPHPSRCWLIGDN